MAAFPRICGYRALISPLQFDASIVRLRLSVAVFIYLPQYSQSISFGSFALAMGKDIACLDLSKTFNRSVLDAR